MTTIRSSRATITLGINVNNVAAHAADDAEETCCICRNTACVAATDADCCLAMATLGCCNQAVCCRCLTKMLLRCTCTDECTAVITYCAFCRQISPVCALDIFRGACCKECPACVKHQLAEERHGPGPLTPDSDSDGGAGDPGLGSSDPGLDPV